MVPLRICYQLLNLLYTLVIPAAALVAFILANAMYLQLMERKVLAHMQGGWGRCGRAGTGILQPVADAVKFIMKEDIIPAKADRWIFSIAPILMLITAFGAFVAIPFGTWVTVLGQGIPLWVANLNIGILYILALSSVGTYGVIMAGWARTTNTRSWAGSGPRRR